MPRKYMFGSKKREDLWQGMRWQAHAAGRGDLPICNLCDLPVQKTDAWDRSHDPGRARSNGGKSVGIAHLRCNREHGAKVVVPSNAKADAQRRNHIGAAGPGLGKCPMRAGKRSAFTKTFQRGVQPRLTLAQKHAATMAKRALFTDMPAED
jgi:hypothetical protein